MGRVELLAPAGSMESLIASVQNGCNAVYLAGQAFGARKFAGNFDEESMVEAVDYCHLRSVKVYITVNTLVKDEEFHELATYIDFLYEIGVDAVIVQDIGVLYFIKDRYPDLECHGSTQMTAHSLEDVNYLYKQGLSRIVLSRELSLDEIRYIRSNTEAELEVFVHGALCVSYSGQCLMSSMIGGRSGNRGSCAQSCRQTYELLDQETGEKVKMPGEYLLSPKDLNTLESIGDLLAADVHSLKIEGRMKRPEYAATVVGAYRKAIEGHIDKADKEDVEAIFNRSFTKGKLFNAQGLSFITVDTPSNRGIYVGSVVEYDRERLVLKLDKDIKVNDELIIRKGSGTIGCRVEIIYKGKDKLKAARAGETVKIPFKYEANKGDKIYRITDADLIKRSKASYQKENISQKVSMIFKMKVNEKAELQVSFGEISIKVQSETVAENPLKRPLDEERITKQLKKLGDYPFDLDKLVCDLDEAVLPASELNAMRREAMTKLSEAIILSYKREKSKLATMRLAHSINENQELSYEVRTIDQLNALLSLGIEAIDYHDERTIKEATAIHNVSFVMPRVTRQFFQVDNAVALVASNWGQIEHAERINYSLYSFNSFALKYYSDKGIKRAVLSPELTLDEIEYLKRPEGLELEVFVYGRMSNMIMAHCPIRLISEGGCKSCHRNEYALVDRFGAVYPLIHHDGCHTEILHHRRLDLSTKLDALRDTPAKYFRLRFTDESYEETIEVAMRFRRALEGDEPETTLPNSFFGHFYDSVE